MSVILCQSIDSILIIRYKPFIMRFYKPICFLVAASLALSSCGLFPTRTVQEATGTSPAEAVIHTLSGETASATPTRRPTETPTPLPAARIEQGERALFIGDRDRALREHQTALDRSTNPDEKAAALLGLSRTYYESGNYSLALSTLRRLTADYPDSPSIAAAYFLFGQVYEATYQYALAAGAYGEYLARKPEPLGNYVRHKQAENLSLAGDYQSAVDVLQAAVDAQPGEDILALQIALGRNYAALGDYASAIHIYLAVYEATDNAYTRAQMNFLAGQAYLALGEYEQAYARFQDSVNNYPQAYDSYSGLVALIQAGVSVDEYQRGLVDYYAGEYGYAIDAFRRYLNQDPAHDGSAHHYIALSHRALDNVEGAVQEWQRMLEDHPGEETWYAAWEELAYTQWAYQENYRAASDTLLRFVSEYPTSAYAPGFLYEAARIMERDGRLSEAAATWTRLIDEYPGAEVTLQGILLAGITHYRLGNYKDAETSFQRRLLLSTDPFDQAASYLWIGKAKAAQGDQGGARSVWQIAAQVDPTGYYSERAAELLEGAGPFSNGQASLAAVDWEAERKKAETWVRGTFDLPPETDLSSPGNLTARSEYQRALAFHELGLYRSASQELDTLQERLSNDPAALTRLLKVMLDLGYYRQAIFTSRQILDLAGLDDAETLYAPAYFNLIRFGTYFQEQVLEAAEREKLDPFLLFSVIRQESMFDGHAGSTAGAAGLMQLMPATGAEVADRLNWPPDYRDSDLLLPLVNIRLGSSYLASLLNLFDGDLYAALAAYNGGPGNAIYWHDLAGDDPDLFLEVVRFEETRTYIRQIYTFWKIYQRFYGGEPPVPFSVKSE